MVKLMRCKSCGGRYNTSQPGGYYHACAPGVADPRDENLDDSVPGQPKRPKKVGKGTEEIEEAD